MTNPRSWLGGAALLAGGLATGLIAADAGLRIYAAVNADFADRVKQHDLMAVQIEPMGRYGYRQRPNSAFRYPNGTVATGNGLGYRGPAVAVPKTPGTLRVVLLGGSTTHGWGVNDSETIDAYMRRELAARLPGRPVEVVNLSFDGYDSYQDYERIRTDGLRFEPDVIIANSGINDVRNARFADLRDPDPRTLLWLPVVEELRAQEVRGGPALKTLLKHYLYLARFASMVHDAFRQRSEELEWRAVGGARLEPHWGALDYFERNLRRIAALAADQGIALLLSTPPSAIPMNYPPDAVSPRDYWITNAAVTQQVRDSLDVRMRAIAADLLKRGQRVAYVPHHLAPRMFLDDAHLTPAGNEALAADLDAEVIAVLSTSKAPKASTPPRVLR